MYINIGWEGEGGEENENGDDRTRPQPRFKSFKQKPNLLIVWNVLLLLTTDSDAEKKKYAEAQRVLHVTIHITNTIPLFFFFFISDIFLPSSII